MYNSCPYRLLDAGLQENPTTPELLVNTIPNHHLTNWNFFQHKFEGEQFSHFWNQREQKL